MTRRTGNRRRTMPTIAIMCATDRIKLDASEMSLHAEDNYFSVKYRE